MIRRAALLLVVLLGADALASDDCSTAEERAHERGCRLRGEQRAPQFEFAPASGAGMGVVCAGTTPTGSKGEAGTYTHTGTTYCTKTQAGGFSTTGIANGDLVLLAANQPRIEYDGTGKLGFLRENTRTNNILRSEELDNAAWTSGGSVAAPPTVTANAAVGPNGATAAERLDFPSVTVGYSVIYNTAGVTRTAVPWTDSVYVRGVGQSDGGVDGGTIYVMSSPDGVSYISAPCVFTSASWTRCSASGTSTAVKWYTQLGFDLRDLTQSGQGAQSVYLLGAQSEAGGYPTSYIPTTSATVTRTLDGTIAFTIPSALPPLSSAVSSTWASGVNSTSSNITIGATNPIVFGLTTSTTARLRVGVGAVTTTPVIPAVGTAKHRIAYWDTGSGSGWAAEWDGVSIAPPAQSLTNAATSFSVGGADSISTAACFDTNPNRCR